MALVSLTHMLVCIVILLVTQAKAAGPIVTDLWIQFATPADPPSVRYSHSAVFNPLFANMIVFGGTGSDNEIYNDISTYTVETSEWATNVETFGIVPAPRYGHTAVVTGLNRMVVFGGRNDSMILDEVVVLDMATMTWLNITINGPAPPARMYHTAVVDRYQHVMYVYGGTSTGEDVLSDMYMLDLDTYTWLLVESDGAQPRAMHSSLMTLQGVMVVFGGVGRYDVACYDVRNQTWYDCVTQASPAPSVRYGHTAVYSPLQQMVVYGGRNDAGNPVNDVWNFDLNSFQWSHVEVGGYPINPRAYHSAVATTFGTMVVFGGIDGDGMTTNDFGLYNLANTVLHSANDGAVLVVMVTLLGTIVLSLCFAMDYMNERNEIEKSEAMEKAKQEALLLPKLPPIPKALQIPLGPRAQRFFDEFKMSLDPMQDPPK